MIFMNVGATKQLKAKPKAVIAKKKVAAPNYKRKK